MEIGSGKEGCFKSQQGHVGSGYKGRKENEGSDFYFQEYKSFYHITSSPIVNGIISYSTKLTYAIIHDYIFLYSLWNSCVKSSSLIRKKSSG